MRYMSTSANKIRPKSHEGMNNGSEKTEDKKEKRVNYLIRLTCIVSCMDVKSALNFFLFLFFLFHTLYQYYTTSNMFPLNSQYCYS